jgi:hypothetical protein
MNRITTKIKVIRDSEISKQVFRNEETNPSVKSTYKCCNCGCNNDITIIPYESSYQSRNN